MSKEFFIRLSGHKSIIINQDGEGMDLSIHVPGGHLLVILDRNEAFQVLEAVQSILEAETA